MILSPLEAVTVPKTASAGRCFPLSFFLSFPALLHPPPPPPPPPLEMLHVFPPAKLHQSYCYPGGGHQGKRGDILGPLESIPRSVCAGSSCHGSGIAGEVPGEMAHHVPTAHVCPGTGMTFPGTCFRERNALCFPKCHRDRRQEHGKLCRRPQLFRAGKHPLVWLLKHRIPASAPAEACQEWTGSGCV